MHAVGVLHRDVKPSNVLMEGRAPILIDFGLARVADDPRLTHTGWLLGTPGYLAPEILYGDDATTASDVHSWAATVAFAGTGRPPFGRGPSMAIMDRVRRGEHDLSGLPDDLRPLVAAALDPDPARRPRLGGDPRPARRTRPSRCAAAAARPVEDPYTLPLAIVAHDRAAAVTIRPAPVPAPPPAGPASLALADSAHPLADRAATTRRCTSSRRPRSRPPPSVRSCAPAAVRCCVALGLLVATAVAAWPYLATVTVLVLTWLLCAATRTATRPPRPHQPPRRTLVRRAGRAALGAVAPRRGRARRAPAQPLGARPGPGRAPALLRLRAGTLHHPVRGRAVPGGAGSGSGPGRVQVRWPLLLVARPLARRTTPWLVALLLLLAAAGITGLLAGGHTDWSPLGAPPAAELRDVALRRPRKTACPSNGFCDFVLLGPMPFATVFNG